MKKQMLSIGLLLICSISTALAHCDLGRFRWACDIPIKTKPSAPAHSLVYCGNVPLYVNRTQYDQITHEQRANMHMMLTINGEYITSPCIPAGRNGP